MAFNATKSATAAGARNLDDEDLVRASAADMLSDIGYSVVEATSAEMALRLIADGLEPDLLITDHLMSGMSGTDLARRARAQLPRLRVLIISGYAEHVGLDPDLLMLSKPFRRDDLASAIAGSAGS